MAWKINSDEVVPYAQNPEQWNNCSGVSSAEQSGALADHKKNSEVTCCEKFLFWANSGACKNLSTLFSPSKASAAVLLPVCHHCPSKNYMNQRKSPKESDEND